MHMKILTKKVQLQDFFQNMLNTPHKIKGQKPLSWKAPYHPSKKKISVLKSIVSSEKVKIQTLGENPAQCHTSTLFNISQSDH